MTNSYTPPADVAAQIDAMCEAASARVGAAQSFTSTDGTQHGSIKTNHDGTVTMLGDVRTPDRIPDDGRDLNVERGNNQRRIDELTAKLDAHTFDGRTGAKVLVAQGQVRESIEAELMSARSAAVFADHRYTQLEQQRERDQAWKNAENEERAARFAFTGGQPAREAAYEEALLRAEADTAAQAALARRYAKAQL